MAEIVQGLFGVSPESLNAQREQALQAQALQYANLNPNQQAQMGFYQAGSRLGTGVAGLMGSQDPEMQRAQLRQQLLRTADTGSVQGLQALASALQQGNDAQGAMQAMQKAQELSKSQGELAYKAAETQGKLAELPKIAAATEELKAKTITEQAKQTATQSRVDSLIAMGLDPKAAAGVASNDSAYSSYLISKKIATPPDYAIQAGIEGIPVKPFLSDYTKEEMTKMEKGVFGHKAGIAAAGRSTVINQQEGAFAKGRGEDQAKALSDARMAAASVGPAIDRLNTLERLNSSGTLFQGPQANASLNAANLLQSAGLISPTVAKSLSNSEVYNKTAKDLVMQDLNGKLGAGISDADRAFVEARIPQLTTSPQARTELIAKLKEIQQGKAASYKDMNDYVMKKGNLNDYDFSKNMLTNVSKPTATTAPSTKTGNPLIDKYLP
jgi:hypothetical protein